MPEYPEKLARLLGTLAQAADRQERIEMLIDIADHFRPVPAEVAARPFPEQQRVPHCESEAYVFSKPQSDGTLKFYFAVENPQGISAKATAVILDECLSGVAPEQVAEVPGDIVYEIFGGELSMGKTMGLMAMVSMVRAAARAATAGASNG